ncbi:MAG: hypothetical protein J0H49_19380 [Acidobacteria bacterium]|nr:hypothetical protein [Acidobacteriota bacterium]
MKPRLSILLPAMKGFDTILAALDTWEAQTCRDALEILVLCPANLGPSAVQAATLSPGLVIVDVGTADLHEARAIGIGFASSAYVMLAEDHCLPDPEWTQMILERLEEGWDAVGPALRPGNRTTCWAEGSFLIGYGEWMMPVKGGPTGVLCGWNVVIRTELLHQRGSALAGDMLMGAFLVRHLRRQGGRFYLEERARMRHFDPPGCAYEFLLLAIVGLGFGAVRTRQWALPLRLLYPLAAPAIAFLHWKRACINFRRAGKSSGVSLASLAATVPLAWAWGMGEAAGAVLGTQRVSPYLWRTEVKPVAREELARSDQSEGLRAGEPVPASRN